MAIVMKFGGTSVGNSQRINQTCEIIISRIDQDPVVVVSAVGGVTDMLINGARSISVNERSVDEVIEDIIIKHNTILDELEIDRNLLDDLFESLKDTYDSLNRISAENMDLITSFGERMSSRIVSANLNKLGFESTHHPAYTIGMLTDNKFGDAQPLSIAYQKIDENLQNIEGIPIITGFIGKNLDGRITTLGRGGSDFTAAIVGASINADEIQIWTDVDGVMTTDPRICSNVQPISEMTFNEAAELAYFGAKVLHPRTIIPAVEKNINVVVKNTMNQDHPGTTIVNNTEDESIVTSISIKRNVMILRIESARMLNAHGFLARIFSIFEKYEVSVDMIATSEVSVSMTLNSDTYTSLIEELEELGNVSIRNDVSIICVVGRNLRNNNRIQSEIFSCIENEGINVRMISQGASLINVGFVIDEENGDKAVRLLHERFIENGY